MNKTFIDQLLAFIATPYGIVGIAVGVLMVVQATRSRSTAWLLFSICCFAASLNKYADRWIKEPPALVVPLQQIRAFGRPLAIVLLILLIFLAIQTKNNWRRSILPQAIKYLCFVQFVIFSKTLLYGSQEFATISALTFGGIIYMLRMGPGRWMQDDENFKLAVRSIAISGLIFVVLNLFQFIINRSAVTFTHGRFLGTTGNPQHAGVLLAAVIPCLMFMIQSSPAWNFGKYFWTIVSIGVVYFLILTGSRTGLLMGVISILLFYRNNGGAWFRIVCLVAIIAAIAIPFLQPENLSASSTGIDSTVSDRFTTYNNSRSGVIDGMLNSFSENILFGTPMQGERMGYGENSWLSVAANLGLAGLIPMLLMGWESFKLMMQLYRLGERQPYYFFQSSTIISGLGAMLIGSCFEAFLLGNITFSMMAFLFYLLMGGYLIEVDRVRTHYARVEAEYAAQSGVYQ